MVENDSDPRLMGLLFAGGNTIAVANPIEEVLTYLNDALKLAPDTLQFVGAAGAGRRP